MPLQTTMTMTKTACVVAFAIFAAMAWPSRAGAQVDLFSKEQRVEFTPQWSGERFADGRPKVADSVLARLKDVTADEAWDVLQDAGSRNRFEGGGRVINPAGGRVGRAGPPGFLPRRPDGDSVI